MRYRIRVETTNRHVHVSAWDDAAEPAEIERIEDTLGFGNSARLWITGADGQRIHFNPAHIVAVSIETEETP